MSRFDTFLSMGRDALASNAPETWDAFFEGITRAYGRYSRAAGIWVDTEKSERITDQIMTILEKEA